MFKKMFKKCLKKLLNIKMLLIFRKSQIMKRGIFSRVCNAFTSFAEIQEHRLQAVVYNQTCKMSTQKHLDCFISQVKIRFFNLF